MNPTQTIYQIIYTNPNNSAEKLIYIYEPTEPRPKKRTRLYFLNNNTQHFLSIPIEGLPYWRQAQFAGRLLRARILLDSSPNTTYNKTYDNPEL